jgi:iron complex transport system substrate-binding protein
VADPAQLLAISAYSHDPASSSMDLATARRFRATSGTVEEVLALRPDVVVGTDYTPPAMVGALGDLGVRLERLPITSNVTESETQIRQLAALVGHPERGEALIGRIETALRTAAPMPNSTPIPAVVWQSGGIVPGDNTLITDLLRRTGFTNFSGSRGMRQADYLPLERMLADPPRVILSAGDAGPNEDRMLSHPALAALKQTRRERLDPSLLWCGGPTIIRAAARLAQVRATL